MASESLLRFVLHEHSARHHHFDFRLEYDGVLKSWAIPKGLPEKPGEKRLAIETEDHPLEYIGFTGTIPDGHYGAGVVNIADTGNYELLMFTRDRVECILHGSRFMGKYVLIRFKKAGENEWLVMKAKDTNL